MADSKLALLVASSWAMAMESRLTSKHVIKLGLDEGMELGISNSMELFTYYGNKLGIKDGMQLLGSSNGIKLGIKADIKLGSDELS
eukprot:7884336-Ditylum_brightwellii.AAC.1